MASDLPNPTPLIDRRRFLAIGAASVGISSLAALGCVPADQDTPTPNGDAVPAPDAAEEVVAASVPAAPPPPPTPTPIPEPPIMPRGREELRLMEGTEWEARATIFHSGAPGPRFMVLGGVHGNEPGGWLAAEEVASWEVERGMLIVLPRLNHRAAAAFQRTLDGIGDLNRAYPGEPDGIPMFAMAHHVTELVRQWRPHWFWDMHESWGFFNERGENSGTAFIGQTITSADPTADAVLQAVVPKVNETITPREELLVRLRHGGTWGRGPGRSSLSMGSHVPGVKAVLTEMGQMNQSEWRRSELQQILLRAVMDHEGSFEVAS